MKVRVCDRPQEPGDGPARRHLVPVLHARRVPPGQSPVAADQGQSNENV